MAIDLNRGYEELHRLYKEGVCELTLVGYGDRDNPDNMAIEDEKRGEVIIDFDRPFQATTFIVIDAGGDYYLITHEGKVMGCFDQDQVRADAVKTILEGVYSSENVRIAEVAAPWLVYLIDCENQDDLTDFQIDNGLRLPSFDIPKSDSEVDWLQAIADADMTFFHRLAGTKND